MKKLLFIVTLFYIFICINNTSAQLRTENQAQKLAIDFLKENNIKKLRSENPIPNSFLELVYAPTIIRPTESVQENVYYYIYNLGNNEGFIIVSGDNRAKQILGYSDIGYFDINEIPDNLKSWLNYYERELDHLASYPLEQVIVPSNEVSELSLRSQNFAPSIAPLVSAKWNQGSPYNNDCPLISGTSKRSVVGCTAIASAQIMHYHKWPKKGKGSLTYNIFNTKTTVKFSEAIYDWGNILNIYSSSASKNDISVQAISQLLYHVSFGAKTNYGEESGAHTKNMAEALVNYFDYDKNIQVYKRDYFSKSEWEDLIKYELNELRPVHYAGYSNDLTSGHAFVCDGYDENGLFHFNWGWGGSSNGYFELSALNPGNLGIGSGSGYYNRGQEIITGIQPPNKESITTYQIYFNKLSLLSNQKIVKNSMVKIKATNLFNWGMNTFEGKIGLGLYTSDSDELNSVFGDLIINELKSNLGWNQLDFSGNFPSQVKAGKYKLYLICKSNKSTEWSKLRGKSGVINYYDVEVEGNNVIISPPERAMPKLELVMDNMDEFQEVYKNRTARIKIEMKNSGGGEYNSFITIAYDKEKKDVFIEKVPILIASGESKEFLFTGKMDLKKSSGDYSLYIFYDKENNFSSSLAELLNTDTPVKIKLKDAGNNIKLTLPSLLTFPNKNKVTPKTFDLQVKIKNDGDYYDGNIYLAMKNAAGSYSSFDSQYLFLEKGETATIHFTNPPEINYGTGSIGVFYSNPVTGSTEWFNPYNNCFISFKYVEDEYTGWDTSDKVINEEVFIYPNPTYDILFLNSERKVTAISIFDSSGKRILQENVNTVGKISVDVNHLDKGLYFLKVQTGESVNTVKFHKK